VSGVDLRLLNLRISDPMNPDVNRKDLYTLWDVYPHADFVTYPSLYEGFGNAFLEAVYFKKPLLINRYAIFLRDIEPKEFDLIVSRRWAHKKLKDIAECVEQQVEDSFLLTIKALGLTVVLAAIWPFLLAFPATQLTSLRSASPFRTGIAGGLIYATRPLIFMVVFYNVFSPNLLRRPSSGVLETTVWILNCGYILTELRTGGQCSMN